MLGRRSILDSPHVRMHELLDAFSTDKLQVGLRLIPMHRRRHCEDSHPALLVWYEPGLTLSVPVGIRGMYGYVQVHNGPTSGRGNMAFWHHDFKFSVALPLRRVE